MQTDRLLTFGSYRLDPHTGWLWRGKHEVRLTGKALAVLRHLVTHAGALVTKDELFQAVWPGTVVSDDALTSCIKELRRGLRDQARERRYIETVHRRGFRFIGKVVSEQYLGVSSPFPQTQSSVLSPRHSVLVGRATDLAFLQERLAKALSGERQVVFVTGEAGIGKTTLIEVFLHGLEPRIPHLASVGQEANQKAKSKNQKAKMVPSSPPLGIQHLTPGLWLGRGQCIEHYGAGEAYLPVLEALGRLCRDSEGEHLKALLHQHAPSWLVQLPSLLSTTELEELQRRTAGVTRERMLRELAQALEVITVERPLVLVLEDLHWSDVSTLDLLSMLARRQERAQILIIGSYRPVEVLSRDHPLKVVKHELQLHRQCEELALEFLSEGAVGEYLAQRFASPSPAIAGEGRGEGLFAAPLQRLAHLIHQRTDGNPLFMVNVVDSLVARGVLVQSEGRWELQGRGEEVEKGVPENLQQLIEQQLARLRPETQRLLEVASVAGAEFSAAAVAAGLEAEVDVVEEQCEELVRREHFLRASGTAEWPDGTVAARYGFLHALYQEVLYNRLTARRRQRLHQQIGERQEAAYGERIREIAAELAVHFERGRDYRKAVQYLQQAGENAVRRSAYQEAISLLTQGLALLQTLPDTPERAQQELELQVALGAPLIATKGYSAPEVGKTYARARELCQQVGETPQLFPVLRGLRLFYSVRSEYRTARELGEQLLRLAQSARDPRLLLEAHLSLQAPLLWLGEVTAARQHAEQGIALYARQLHRSQALVYDQDPGVTCLSYAAFALWYLGYPTQALNRSHETLTLAQELAHPFSLAYAVFSAALLHRLRREGPAVQKQAEVLITLSREQGFATFVKWGTMLRGWARVEQGKVEEGIAQVRQGLAAASTGLWLLLVAEVYERGGQAEEELSVLAELLTMVHKNGTLVHEAELYRLKGELTLQQQFRVQSSEFKVPSPQPLTPSTQAEAEAETSFLKAMAVARHQQAKSLELRATVSLARLWQKQGKQKEARRVLAEIYGWFTEGFDTKDLQEAKALIEGVSRTLD